MKKSDMTYMVGCAFTAAVSIFYCCIIHFNITVPKYYPTLHEWRWDKVEGVASQGWYGIQGFAFIAGGIVAVAAYIACKKAGAGKQIELKTGTVKGVALATITVVLLAMAYIMQHEFHRWGTI